MRLYLARHGEALPKHIDPDAPLSQAGRSDVKSVASFIAKGPVKFERIIHSGKTRARQTAEIFAQAIGDGVQPDSMQGLDPMDPPENLIADLHSWNEDTLVVGHMPFMGNLLDMVITDSRGSGIAEFTTCSIVCLQRNAGKSWIMRWMLIPELFSRLEV